MPTALQEVDDAPDFELPGDDGATTRLAALRGSRVTLIDPEGVVARVGPKVKVQSHAAEVLEEVLRLQG